MTRQAALAVGRRRRASMAALVVANLAPIAGVLLFDWSVFLVLMVYWLENVILGVLNVFRMALCRGPNSPWAMKLFMIPFFSMHYGMFTYVHGIFVIDFFGQDGMAGDVANPTAFLWSLVDGNALTVAALALAASHLVSFFVNYLFGGEYRRVKLGELMFAPYGRVVVLHVTILIGGALVEAMGAPIWALLLLAIVKTAIDLGAHERSHRKLAVANVGAADAS